MTRLFLALLFLLTALTLVCWLWLNNLLAQALVWAVLTLALLALSGFQRWLGSLKLVLPFFLTLASVYLLFGVIGVKTPSNEPGSLLGWLEFGLLRILLFINTVLVFRIFFALVSFDDLLRLPLKIGIQKYVLLGQSLYETAFSAYPELLAHQRQIASEQRSGLSFTHRFKARSASLLALLLSLLQTARYKGDQIDNRIILCHGGKQGRTGDWAINLGFIVLVTAATMLVPIPVPGGGFFNFGDVMIVFVGLYAGKKAGALAGGIGSAIADLLLFPLFAPITLAVKGLEGFICGLAHDKAPWLKIVLPLLGSCVIVIGYFLGEWFMPTLGKAVALADLPVNIVQASAGFIGGRALFAAAQYLDL